LPLGRRFIKSWALRNASSGPWPEGSRLVFVEGDQMGGPDEQEIAPLPTATETITVSVALVAPASAGEYEGIWRIEDADGDPISEEFHVVVVVYRPSPPTPPPPQLTEWGIQRCNVTFKWNWSGTLAEHDWFAVRVGKGTEPPHSVVWVKEREYIYVLSDSGEYSWEVAVCRGDPGTHACEQLAVSEGGIFSFGGCAGAPGPPTPPIP
jgi:hypothetical protein